MLYTMMHKKMHYEPARIPDRPLMPGEVINQIPIPVPQRRRRCQNPAPPKSRSSGFNPASEVIVLPPPPPSYIRPSLGHTIHVARVPPRNNDKDMLARLRQNIKKSDKILAKRQATSQAGNSKKRYVSEL
jgi:hypothetical protein